jgi:histidinol-phosphate aminotransferase
MMERRAFLRTGVAAGVAGPFLTLRQRLAALEGWDAVRAAAASVRLSSNENPLGIPESARLAAAGALAEGNRYPNGKAELAAAVAKKHGVKPENVVLGNGSTEILQMVVQSMATPLTTVVIGDPTFEHVEAYAESLFLNVVRVPLTPEHTLDLAAMQRAAGQARAAALVYICNPNNPTGTIVPTANVEAWIRASNEKVTFLLDEAYIDFVEDPALRTLTHLTVVPNVIVTRTFSKIYGLAGLRIGYAIALEETATQLERFAANSNVNQIGIAAARACIDDEAYMKRSLASNRAARKVALDTLAELDIETLPSHTNFLMHRVKGNVGAHIARMAGAGIAVGRAFPPMLDWNRVSIGTVREMEAWAEALRGLRKGGLV